MAHGQNRGSNKSEFEEPYNTQRSVFYLVRMLTKATNTPLLPGVENAEELEAEEAGPSYDVDERYEVCEYSVDCRNALCSVY